MTAPFDKQQMIQTNIRHMIEEIIVPVVKESIGTIYTSAADDSLRQYANDELDKVFKILPLDTQFLGFVSCKQSANDIIRYAVNQSKELLYERNICPVDPKSFVSHKTNEDRLERAYIRVVQKTTDHLRLLPPESPLYGVPMSSYTTNQLQLAIKKGYNAILTYLLKTSVDGSYLAVITSGAAIYRIYTPGDVASKKKSSRGKKRKDTSSIVIPLDHTKDQSFEQKLDGMLSKENIRFMVILPSEKVDHTNHDDESVVELEY